MKYTNAATLAALYNVSVVTTQHLDCDLRKTGEFVAILFKAELQNDEVQLQSVLLTSEPSASRHAAWYKVVSQFLKDRS